MINRSPNSAPLIPVTEVREGDKFILKKQGKDRFHASFFFFTVSNKQEISRVHQQGFFLSKSFRFDNLRSGIFPDSGQTNSPYQQSEDQLPGQKMCTRDSKENAKRTEPDNRSLLKNSKVVWVDVWFR